MIDKLTNNKIRSFFREGRSLKFDRGEIILNAGDEPEGVYYIESGFIKVYSISNRGEEYVHLVYKSGEIFPLVWAIKNILHDIFYEAVSDSRLWRVPKSQFLSFIKNDKEALYLILNQLAEQFDVHIDRIDNLEYRQARERVAYRLLTLAKRFGRKRNDHIIIKAPFTHQLIADSINLTRESVSREIEKLEKKKVITYSAHKIIIKNAKALAQELDQSK